MNRQRSTKGVQIPSKQNHHLQGKKNEKSQKNNYREFIYLKRLKKAGEISRRGGRGRGGKGMRGGKQAFSERSTLSALHCDTNVSNLCKAA